MMVPLRAQVPAENHYETLSACQAAWPVHTDARGYGQAWIAPNRRRDAGIWWRLRWRCA